MATDGTQALAERLHVILCRNGSHGFSPDRDKREATLILADGSVYLIPDEAARYRAIEEAADHIVALRAAPLTDGWWISDEDFAALRAALEVSR